MIYSIGYQKLDQKTLIEILKAHQVEVLVDVRSRPYGRKAVFNRKEIERWLPATGIEYLWKGDILGGFAPSRRRPSSGWPTSVASEQFALCAWRQIRISAIGRWRSAAACKPWELRLRTSHPEILGQPTRRDPLSKVSLALFSLWAFGLAIENITIFSTIDFSNHLI